MKLFWIFLTVDVITLLTFLYFFVVGIIDTSVSSNNIGLWLLTFLVLVGILIASYFLKLNGNIKLANLVLGIPAVPAIIFGLWILLILITNPRWN